MRVSLLKKYQQTIRYFPFGTVFVCWQIRGLIMNALWDVELSQLIGASALSKGWVKIIGLGEDYLMGN